MAAPSAGALPEGRAVAVWDPLVRLAHWGVAAAIVLNMTVIDEEAKAHVWIGYAAFGLLGLRLLWGLVGPAPARFSAFPPSLSGALAHVSATLTGTAKPHLSHNPLGALMVYALWATLAVVSVSGLMLESTAWWGVGAVEEVHEAAADLLVGLAALHVAGVLVESRLSGVDLVRAMLTGVKRLPPGSDAA
jgi:cytochrome b